MIKQVQLLAGVLFVSILIYSGLWYTAAFQAEKDVTALLSNWRDQGLQVEHGKIEHGGFPYRITVGVQDLHVGTRKGGLDLQVENMQLVSHLWTPQHWLIESNGVKLEAASQSTVFNSDFMLASYRVHADGKTLIAFDSAASNGFSLIRFLGQDAPTPETWQLFFRFGGTSDAPQSSLYGERFLGFKLAASRQGTALDFIGGISGPSVEDWTKDQLLNWSNEGGLLEIDQLTISANGGTIKGNASLTLDENFKPLGSAVLTIVNGQKIASAFEETGLSLPMELPTHGPLGVMMQNGSVIVNNTPILPLKPVVD